MSLWKISLSQNSNKIISGFLPWNFGSFLGASWKFFWASCRLPYLFMISLIKSQGSPKSFQEAPKKLQKISGQKFRNNFVASLGQTNFSLGYYKIIWPLKKWQKITAHFILVIVTKKWNSSMNHKVFNKVLVFR